MLKRFSKYQLNLCYKKSNVERRQMQRIKQKIFLEPCSYLLSTAALTKRYLSLPKHIVCNETSCQLNYFNFLFLFYTLLRMPNSPPNTITSPCNRYDEPPTECEINLIKMVYSTRLKITRSLKSADVIKLILRK